LFGRVFDIIRRDYVEKPSGAKLIASAINGMVSGLDPHSSYMDVNDFRNMQVETSGRFGGLGIQVTMKHGFVEVVSCLADTPAEKAGILAGDVIAKVDGQPIAGLSLQQVVTKLRGPPAAWSRSKLRAKTKRCQSRRQLCARSSGCVRSAIGSRAMMSAILSSPSSTNWRLMS
jgi:carboxyl-terminal processing protease